MDSQAKPPFNTCCFSLKKGLCVGADLELQNWKTTRVCKAPSNHWSVGQDGCKCGICRHNILHVLELILNSGAVTAMPQVTTDPSAKKTQQTQPLWPELSAHMSALILDCRAIATRIAGLPQQLTDPAPEMANAKEVWLEFAARSGADVEQRSCHHHSIHCPRQRLNH